MANGKYFFFGGYVVVEWKVSKVVLDISKGSLDFNDVRKPPGVSHSCWKTWWPCSNTILSPNLVDNSNYYFQYGYHLCEVWEDLNVGNLPYKHACK